MITRYAIKVTETIHADDRSVEMLPVYFVEYFKHAGHLKSSARAEKTFDTLAEAEAVVKELPVEQGSGNYVLTLVYEVVAIDYTHANMHGWSDVTPFEIVRVVSPKTIEVRAMIAEQDESFKPEIIPGGFAGHCVNQGQQKWNYKSAPEGMVLRARLRKDGNFHSNYGKHVLSTEPRKFYDYNF